MGSPVDWSLYRSFLAVLRDGSLSGAARMLCLTQPTLGRHIAELEHALGAVLFTRSPQGLVPTDTARDLEPHAEAMAAAASSLERAASGGMDAERGVVRITASEIVGAEVLPALLADFRRLHPGVTIELVLSNRLEDLLRGEADIAVRMVRPTQAALVVRRVGTVALGLYGHRRYLGDAPPPVDLASAALIGFDRETPFLRRASDALSISREQFVFRADSDLAQLAAIRAGLGIGFIQHGIARRDSDLLPVFPAIGFALDMWLALHEDLRASRRVRLAYRYLADGLSAYAATSAAPVQAG